MEIDRAVERGDKDDKAGAKRQRSAGHPVHAAEGDPIGVPEIREEENQPGEDLQGREVHGHRRNRYPPRPGKGIG